MFHLIAGLYAQYNSKTTVNVLLVGPSEAGKTSFIERLKLDQRVAAGRAHSKGGEIRGSRRQRLDRGRIAPTVGQNVLDLDLPSTRARLHFWDLGGAPQLRRIWRQYYDEADLLIYMVDGTRWEALAREEMGGGDAKGKAKEVVRGAMSDEEAREDAWEALRSTASSLGDLPLLILVNKLDEPALPSAAYDDDGLGGPLSSANGGAATGTTPSHLILESVRDFFQERVAKFRAARLEEGAALEDGPRKAQEDEGGREDAVMWEDVDVLGISALDGNGVAHAMEWLKSRALSIKASPR